MLLKLSLRGGADLAVRSREDGRLGAGDAVEGEDGRTGADRLGLNDGLEDLGETDLLGLTDCLGDDGAGVRLGLGDKLGERDGARLAERLELRDGAGLGVDLIESRLWAI